jgi:hypothetical protein
VRFVHEDSSHRRQPRSSIRDGVAFGFGEGVADQADPVGAGFGIEWEAGKIESSRRGRRFSWSWMQNA